MKKEIAVLILDMDKLKELEGWWDKSMYVAKVDEANFSKVTDAVEKIQEEELEDEVIENTSGYTEIGPRAKRKSL